MDGLYFFFRPPNKLGIFMWRNLTEGIFDRIRNGHDSDDRNDDSDADDSDKGGRRSFLIAL